MELGNGQSSQADWGKKRHNRSEPGGSTSSRLGAALLVLAGWLHMVHLIRKPTVASATSSKPDCWGQVPGSREHANTTHRESPGHVPPCAPDDPVSLSPYILPQSVNIWVLTFGSAPREARLKRPEPEYTGGTRASQLSSRHTAIPHLQPLESAGCGRGGQKCHQDALACEARIESRRCEFGHMPTS